MTATAEKEATGTLVHLPVDRLLPGPGLNPRTHFDQAALEELAASIRAEGMHQPLCALPRSGDYPLNGADVPDQVTHYIYAGERRWRAAELAGAETVPVLVREIDYRTALGIALVENLQREDLSPVEEARGLQRYMEANPKLSQKELGESLGYSQSWVANRVRLLKLPDEILDHVQVGALHATAARDLLLPFAQLREDLRETWWTKLTASLNRTLASDPALPLSEDKVKEIVRRVGIKLSKPTSKSYDWNVDDDRPRLTPEGHHEGCDCNAPGFNWSEAMYASKTVRCFDPERWEELEADAQEAWEERRAARDQDREEEGHATPEERIEALGVEDRTETVPRERIREALTGPGQWETVWSGYSEELRELLDPSHLDPGTLYRVEGHTVAGEQRPDDVICLDPEAFEDATAAASERFEAEYDRRRRERGERDAEEAGWAQPNAQGMALLLAGDYRREPTILGILGDLGHLPEEPENRTLLDLLSGLQAREIFQVSKILAMRIERGDATTSPWANDPLIAEVRQDLHAEYTEALREIAPGGELPGPEPEGEDEAEPAGEIPEFPNPGSKTMSAEVWGMVARRLQEDPDPSVQELYDRAKRIDSDTSKLTLRQFNARYVLQVKRRMAGGRD